MVLKHLIMLLMLISSGIKIAASESKQLIHPHRFGALVCSNAINEINFIHCPIGLEFIRESVQITIRRVKSHFHNSSAVGYVHVKGFIACGINRIPCAHSTNFENEPKQ